MNLKYLLSPWANINLDVDIIHIENNSRKVLTGTLFFAYPGALADGRSFIASAIDKGATAILYEPKGFIMPDVNIPLIAIEDLKNKISAIAARFYSNPSKDLNIIGITGTNGKTTVAYQLASAYLKLENRSAYIGTIGQGIPGQLQDLVNTTPDGVCLQKLFFEYLNQKVKTVCIEVSSHALCEGRVNNIEFNEAIYTNLSPEHLDYHKTMPEYAAAKAQLFAKPNLQRAIINIDDEYANVMLAACSKDCQIYTYGFNAKSDFQAYACVFNLDGCNFKVKSKYGDIALTCQGIGVFNIYNSLAIFTSLMLAGYARHKVVDIIANLEPVSGRMELVAKEPYVFVDYSHTPDALANALQALVNLRNKSQSSGKIWVVFGCGGDRDHSKRAMMGEIASNLADEVIVTSDNPRTEDPLQIINEIVLGIDTSKNIKKIIDRAEAIIYSLIHSSINDSILIAGKGHEDYQIIGNKKSHFSDKEIILKNLNQPSNRHIDLF